MSMIIILAILVILIAAVGAAVFPFLTWKSLPEGAEINGMYLVKDGFVGAAIVPLSAHEVALVDAGVDAEAKMLLAELSRRGLGSDDVKVILLTHAHGDHIAGIAKFPKAQVMALAEEVDVVEGRSTSGGLLLRLRSPKPTGILTLRGPSMTARWCRWAPTKSGFFIVPGHTPGCAAYAIGGNLFLGDSANHGKDGRLKGGHWIFNKSSA
jgi:glyoxylase-like metal-dependent hydrolase (beta-lactamase superfamily II)